MRVWYIAYIYIHTYIYIYLCVRRGHECHSHILGAILWQQTATCPFFVQRRSDLGDVHICVDVKQGRQFHCFLCTEWELRKLRQSLCQWLLTLPETQQIPTIVTRVPQLHTSKPITWWHLEVSQGFIESMFCDRSRHNGHQWTLSKLKPSGDFLEAMPGHHLVNNASGMELVHPALNGAKLQLELEKLLGSWTPCLLILLLNNCPYTCRSCLGTNLP